MEISPTMLASLGLALIGYIVWQVRLESKLSAISDSLKRIETEQNDSWKEFENHRLNGEIHFDKSHSKTIQATNEKEFARLESDIKEIKQMVRELIKR
jgi:hypothetical protein